MDHLPLSYQVSLIALQLCPDALQRFTIKSVVFPQLRPALLP
ncbi:hypothetical protein B224_3143 [Aeromonas media WS]|nr:hypothetical protein B224_3143 [Aeromonas media WS]